jgi:hypothetical protein
MFLAVGIVAIFAVDLPKEEKKWRIKGLPLVWFFTCNVLKANSVFGPA